MRCFFFVLFFFVLDVVFFVLVLVLVVVLLDLGKASLVRCARFIRGHAGDGAFAHDLKNILFFHAGGHCSVLVDEIPHGVVDF